MDKIKKVTGKHPTADTITHCRRELMHKVLSLIFDQEFSAIHQDGIVIKCADGIMRHIFPRIFTYSADYPEKCVNLYSTHHDYY